jgi:hypothetical protein
LRAADKRRRDPFYFGGLPMSLIARGRLANALGETAAPSQVGRAGSDRGLVRAEGFEPPTPAV